MGGDSERNVSFSCFMTVTVKNFVIFGGGAQKVFVPRAKRRENRNVILLRFVTDRVAWLIQIRPKSRANDIKTKR